VVLSGSGVTWGTVAVLAAMLGVYVVYLLLIAAFLAVCGVSRTKIAEWALKQAERKPLADLIRAARGLPPSGEPP
jgi:hypothetical protein